MPKGFPKNGINKGWFKKGHKNTYIYKPTQGFQKGHKVPKEWRDRLSNLYTGKPNGRKGIKNPKITGEKNWHFKKRKKHSSGYILVYQPNLGKHIYEHRFVVEQCIGRPLKSEERVHHINNKVDDNKPENLILFPTDYAHRSYHRYLASKK